MAAKYGAIYKEMEKIEIVQRTFVSLFLMLVSHFQMLQHTESVDGIPFIRSILEVVLSIGLN